MDFLKVKPFYYSEMAQKQYTDIQVYLKRISDERVLTMTEIKIVFSNAEQLFQLHREILSDLRKDLGLSRLDFSQSNVRTDFSATRLISVFSKWVCKNRVFFSPSRKQLQTNSAG
jgi:hypothetical protein